MLHQNVAVMDSVATCIEKGALPRVALVVTNPLDVMTEYLTRRWSDRPVAVMGSGTALETLRLTDRVARECGVHPRSRVGQGIVAVIEYFPCEESSWSTFLRGSRQSCEGDNQKGQYNHPQFFYQGFLPKH